MTFELNRLYNMDCMEALRQMPDKCVDLAICDPPYGIGEDSENMSRSFNKDGRARPNKKWSAPKQRAYGKKTWDESPPEAIYFEELRRVSINQIIFGANHFISKVPIDSPCWIVWDKKNGKNDFADCELAWTSFHSAVRKFEWLWNGFQQQKPEDRFHPTQKPVALYKWLLTNYAKPGDKILDTHVGSASSLIACYDLGFDFLGFELDADYFNAAQGRLQKHMAQERLELPTQTIEQVRL